jgi:hypothetical protein
MTGRERVSCGRSGRELREEKETYILSCKIFLYHLATPLQ